MDQDAFRSLLATPARPSDHGRSPTASRAPATSRFGIAPPKRALPQSKDLSTDLKPRKVNSSSTSKPRRNPDGSLYRDRAAERRAGRDGDFADAEKLLEDFKTRSETAGVSKDVLEDQMKYLGGDEHHSILVKGLDIALLERKKAELAQKAERELDDVEDELDAAFNENPAAPPLSGTSPPPRPSTSTARGAGGGDQTLPKRKKTRDELIAEMKAMRAGQAAATGASEGGGGGGGASESRFKPIGSTGTDKKGKGKETASGGWKTVGGAGVGDDGGEKKKRKKRKVVPPTAASAAAAAADQTLSTALDSTTASAPSKELPSTAPTASVPAPAPVLDDDDDMDIFGDVGDYKGLDTDEESDAGGGQGSSAAAAAPAASTSTGTGKRKYFDDDEEEEDTIGTSTAPTGLEDLAARQAAANAAAVAGSGAGPSPGAGAGGAEQDQERGEDRPMRLEGLSGAGPSVKELLEMDKAAEAEEKRQARKLKAKEKAEARRANMTEADKANQDYQKMMAHLEKKDGPSGGGGGGKKHSP